MDLLKTKDNKARVDAIKTIKETQWCGETIHDTLDKCLVAINLFHRLNSGWYNPKAIKIKGLYGIFMLNESGSLCVESRVIKISENEYRIEHLTNEGFNNFESRYLELINYK